ncbi:alginate lyase family protein [Paenibacillus sp. 32352]|uniref:OmpL47-type beta-barrel domain-containing protein n=1 Tax=Paenibacillus sp. 32352 TaxID=1969111 RepID=UPI0009AF1D05|nr:alginate lyase family protein [Paenibacillus sp. 32352]
MLQARGIVYIALALLISMVTSVAALTLSEPGKASASPAFVHPGMLHTQADLDLMKAKTAAGESPWAPEWDKVRVNKLASPKFTATVYSTVYLNDPLMKDTGKGALADSATAAYFNALGWHITGDPAYANKAIDILNRWSHQLTGLQGNDAILGASLIGYKLLNAAELIRYSNAGWGQPDIEKFSSMMTNVFYSQTKNYAFITRTGAWANGNWDAAAILFNMCYGIWNNDDTAYNDAVHFMKTGPGNGSIEHYVQTEDGQTQESGRDQAHAQLGLGLLSLAAEVGYNQRTANANGADLYAYPNNAFKLLKGIEYTARYNLGYSVSWTTLPDVNGEIRYERNVSSANRGEFRPMYEQIYSFYKNRIGVPDSEIQYTKQVIDRVKLESFHIDHPSYGGLLHAKEQRTSSLLPKIALIPRNTINKYISAGQSGANPLTADRDRYKADGSLNIGPEETFELAFQGNKKYTLKSMANGSYVSAGNGGASPLQADRSSAGNEQLFEIDEQTNGLFTIKAMANNKFITLNSGTKQLEADADSVTADDGRFIVMYPPEDVAPPVTVATLNPQNPDGVNGWYHSDVTVTLSASDGQSGLADTKVRVNGGEWTTYREPLTFSEGIYDLEFRSLDYAGNEEQVRSVNLRIDKTPPVIDVKLDKTTLWPANHKMITVNATIASNDPMSGIASIVLTSITSSEKDDGRGDGSSPDDIQNAELGTEDTTFDLRAERSGSGNGRVYSITYKVTDYAGNSSIASATVTVPHHQ